MIRYDPHAVFQMTRRGIVKNGRARDPKSRRAETKGDKRSFLLSLPGRREMLRVVTRLEDPEYVITAYFDRRKPCE